MKGSRARLASQAFATPLERQPEGRQLERGSETQSGSQADGPLGPLFWDTDPALLGLQNRRLAGAGRCHVEKGLGSKCEVNAELLPCSTLEASRG